MLIGKVLSGTLVTTDDLINAFNELSNQEPRNTVESEGVLLALEIKDLLVDFREVETDPTNNPHLVNFARQEIADAVSAYLHEYVI
jgi:hypothetical protein